MREGTTTNLHEHTDHVFNNLTALCHIFCVKAHFLTYLSNHLFSNFHVFWVQYADNFLFFLTTCCTIDISLHINAMSI